MNNLRKVLFPLVFIAWIQHACASSNERLFLGGNVGVHIDEARITHVFGEKSECPDRNKEISWLFGDYGAVKDCIELTNRMSIDVYFYINGKRIDETWDIRRIGESIRSVILVRPNGWLVYEPNKRESCKVSLDEYLSVKGINRIGSYWIKKDKAILMIDYEEGRKEWYIDRTATLLKPLKIEGKNYIFSPSDLSYDFRGKISCVRSKYIKLAVDAVEATWQQP